VADQTKANGRNRQPQQPASDPLKHQSGRYQRESRPKRNHQCGGCNNSGTQHDNNSLRPDGVEQFTAG
jgi:hypothetical protein